MKDWVAKTQAARGARRPRRFRRPVRRRAAARLHAPAAGHLAPTASAPRLPSPRPMDIHDTIGFDLVGMVVDDIVVVRRRAALHDRLHRLRPGRAGADRRASSRASREACVVAGCALVGGETAEHPGLLGPDEYDVAGAATGVVERDRHPRRRTGSAPATSWSAMASSGLHSNGYSLVRQVFGDAGWQLDRARPRARPHAGRGAAGADPGLRRGRARPGRRRPRGARPQPCHRRRPRGQPGPRPAARPVAVDVDRSTWSPAPVFGLVAGARPGAARGPGAHAQHGRRHARRAPGGRGRRRRTPAGRARRAGLGRRAGPTGRRPAKAGQSRGAKGVDGGAVALVGDIPHDRAWSHRKPVRPRRGISELSAGRQPSGRTRRLRPRRQEPPPQRS